MQRNALCSSELLGNVVEGATFCLREADPGEGEGKQGHGHEEEVDILSADFLFVGETDVFCLVFFDCFVCFVFFKSGYLTFI